MGNKKRSREDLIELKIQRQKDYLDRMAEEGSCSSRGNVIHTWEPFRTKNPNRVPRTQLTEKVTCSKCKKEIIIQKNTAKYSCSYCGSVTVRIGNIYI